MNLSPVSSTQPAAAPESNHQGPSRVSTTPRVLQACHACRRRKTKCSGKRPTCSACALRHLSCEWPSTPEDGAAVRENSNDDDALVGRQLALEARPPKRRRLSPSWNDGESGRRPSADLLRRALDIFRKRHFGVEFCSFLHMPSVDIAVLRQRSPFFAHALVSLSALYMSEHEAAEEGFATPEALSEWHAVAARDYSRQSVDAPSISSIQANLILGMRELLTRTLHKAWMFTGVAVRQAQALRLGVEYHSRLPNRPKEVQRRTYWAAFIMDRLVSHCCWRPRMIDSHSVRLNLPCPEATFLLQEPSNTPNLESLTFPCEISRLGLAPHFIGVFHLWSQATYTYVMGGRRFARSTPDDPQGFFTQHENKVDEIIGSLSATMQWSVENWRTFHHMNQGALFVHFHLLLNHAKCVMHQEYLPYQDFSGVTSNCLHPVPEPSCPQCRNRRIIRRCRAGSEAILSVMTDLSDADDEAAKQDLQCVYGADTLLSAANIQLWAHYVDGGVEEQRSDGLNAVDKLEAVLETWKRQWPVADSWISTLASLRRLYHAAYASAEPTFEEHPSVTEDVQDPAASTAEAAATAPTPTETQDAPQLTEGQGLPLLDERMSDKVRFILLASLEDAGARQRVLSSSMSPQAKDHFGIYESFLPEDLDFDFHHMYNDELWSSGFDANFGIDTAAIAGSILDLDPAGHIRGDKIELGN